MKKKKYWEVLDIDTYEFKIGDRGVVVVNDGQYIWDCLEEGFKRLWHSEAPEFTPDQIERDGYEWLVYQDFCDSLDYLRDTDPVVHQQVVEAMSAEFLDNCEDWNWA
jgi:hypothetical protein